MLGIANVDGHCKGGLVSLPAIAHGVLGRIEAEFEHGRPRQSVVSIRPWLLGEQGGTPAAPAEGSAGAETGPPETSDADGGAGSEDA